jgi:prevent-host-death family protein
MEVGVLEGRNRFSQLVEAAERGETTLIVKRGKPVARLVPYHDKSAAYAALSVEERIASRRAALAAAEVLGREITARNGRRFTHEELMDAKNEGRR